MIIIHTDSGFAVPYDMVVGPYLKLSELEAPTHTATGVRVVSGVTTLSVRMKWLSCLLLALCQVCKNVLLSFVAAVESLPESPFEEHMADMTRQKECERKPLLTLSAACKLLPEGTLGVVVLGEPSIRTKKLPSIRRVHSQRPKPLNGPRLTHQNFVVFSKCLENSKSPSE
jgi:hypothetical protein